MEYGRTDCVLLFFSSINCCFSVVVFFTYSIIVYYLFVCLVL